MDHAHLSFLHLLVTFLGLLPFFFLWRVLTVWLSSRNSDVGAAMGFIF